MVTVNDWLRAVSEVISARAADNRHRPVDKDSPLVGRAIENLLREYSPFKPDVAYMPVTRCDECKHWEEGVCEAGMNIFAAERKIMWTASNEAILTSPDFGCVQWEKKDV